jgi:hypothetical protein
VAKWQTRQLEGLVGEIPWGFKSPLRHHHFLAFPLVTALRWVWITGSTGPLSAICQQIVCAVPPHSGQCGSGSWATLLGEFRLVGDTCSGSCLTLSGV